MVLSVAQADLKQRADGRGAGGHSLAIAVIVDALDKPMAHRNGDAFGFGHQGLSDHGVDYAQAHFAGKCTDCAGCS